MSIRRAMIALLLAFPACGDDPVDVGMERACTEEPSSVETTITTNGTVTFDWSPACAVALLLVEEDASDQWSVNTPETDWNDPDLANRILPPVTYGVTPPGVFEVDGPEPLVSGTRYDLVLWRIRADSTGTDCVSNFENACLLAVDAFTR